MVTVLGITFSPKCISWSPPLCLLGLRTPVFLLLSVPANTRFFEDQKFFVALSAPPPCRFPLTSGAFVRERDEGMTLPSFDHLFPFSRFGTGPMVCMTRSASGGLLLFPPLSPVPSLARSFHRHPCSAML